MNCSERGERLADLSERISNARTVGEELLADGGWHREGADLGAWDLLVDGVFADLAREFEELRDTVDVSPSLGGDAEKFGQEVAGFLASISQDAARLEILHSAIQVGRALADPKGILVDNLLKKFGIQRPLPEHREAIFHVVGAVLRREIHRAWRDSSEETPERVTVRIKAEVLRRAKAQIASFGASRPIRDRVSSALIYELGVNDCDRLEFDRRAASRMAKATPWTRRRRVTTEPTEMRMETEMRTEMEMVTAMDLLQNPESQAAAAEEAGQLYGTLVAFSETEASEQEQQLIEAFFEHGSAAGALQAVGEAENWPRWQSLQRKLQRRQ